jgi:HK97 family phage major capsid protein
VELALTTPTIDQLIAREERRREAAESRRQAARRGISALIRSAEDAGASHLTGQQSAAAEGWQRDRAAAREEIAAADSMLDHLRQLQAEDDEYARQSQRSTPAARPLPADSGGYDRQARIGHEPEVYRAAANPAQRRPEDGPSFLQDLYRAQIMSDPAALSRLERHGRQVEAESPLWPQLARSTGSTAVPGFVPPQYLADLFAEYARAGRPLANLCGHAPLPAEGMVMNLPRITTPTATGVQTAEAAALANQDPQTTLLSPPVVTIAGYVDMSRQALERGALLEDAINADLAADYNSKLDLQLINGSGASGQHLGLLNVAGINAVTYTDAAPALVGTGKLWQKLMSAIGQVRSGRFQGPSALVVSPTQWAWMCAQLDSSNRPVITGPAVSYNPLGTTTPGADYSGTAGNIAVPVVLDGNIPANLGAGTNETRIIVASFGDCILMEDGAAPVQLRFEQVASANLLIRLLAYGYSAFFGGRQPKGISVVSGTGLITPAL